jgi:biopolymer transport protein ExbD
MGRRKMEKQEEAQIDLTPMLDVTFIMLIFFIVTAQFVKEPGIRPVRPEAQTAADLRPAILVGVSEKSEVWINKRIVDVREVKAVVQQLREDNPLGQLVIQTDRNAEAGVVNEVMLSVQAAGVDAVNISTTK